MESGIHYLLHSNCHHCITFSKFDLAIHYPHPYEWEAWNYQKANLDEIRQEISELP